jgi:hypothetical protein
MIVLMILFEYKRTLKETKKWYKQLEEADETVLTSEELKDNLCGLSLFLCRAAGLFQAIR